MKKFDIKNISIEFIHLTSLEKKKHDQTFESKRLFICWVWI
jgi:hypothetical protein